MTTATNKPADNLRDGSLKATIWGNVRTGDGEPRTIYSVTFSRTYQDGNGNYRDSDSFSGSELLRIARLADQAYTRIEALKQADRQPAS